jgi:hypothetical protein
MTTTLRMDDLAEPYPLAALRRRVPDTPTYTPLDRTVPVTGKLSAPLMSASMREHRCAPKNGMNIGTLRMMDTKPHAADHARACHTDQDVRSCAAWANVAPTGHPDGLRANPTRTYNNHFGA